MLITQNQSTCKNIGRNFIKPPICGNLVPHVWYHKLLRPCGKSDTTAIAILSELLFLYRYNCNTEFRLNFKSLAKKFNFGVNQVRDAIIRLESSNLVSRDLRTIIVEGRKFTKEMFLVLNIANIQNITNGDSSDNSEFRGGNNFREYLEISSVNIDKKNLKEISRSSQCIFNSNSLGNSENSNVLVPNRLFLQSRILSKVFGKALSEFYPLSAEDVSHLQIKSGREFDTNFVNQLLLKVSKKHPNHLFYSKKSVLNYVAKLLTFELRDAVKVSNGNFIFICNQDQELRQQEQYLSEVELSRETSYDSQLRRKIAGTFSRKLAYRLLHASTFKLQGDNVFKIIIAGGRALSLTKNQELLLFEQIRSVYGKTVTKVECTTQGPVNNKENKEYHDVRGLLEQGKRMDNINVENVAVISNSSVWGRVRKHLVEYFKEQGRYLDEAWFSKLSALENREYNQLILKAPTNFIRSYVTNEYKQLIANFCALENYQLGAVI